MRLVVARPEYHVRLHILLHEIYKRLERYRWHVAIEVAPLLSLSGDVLRLSILIVTAEQVPTGVIRAHLVLLVDVRVREVQRLDGLAGLPSVGSDGTRYLFVEAVEEVVVLDPRRLPKDYAVHLGRRRVEFELTVYAGR